MKNIFYRIWDLKNFKTMGVNILELLVEMFVDDFNKYSDFSEEGFLNHESGLASIEGKTLVFLN